MKGNLTPAHKGAILGAGFSFVLLGLPLIWMMPQATHPAQLRLLLYLLAIILIGSALGAIWGYAAGQFTRCRYIKILGVALLGYGVGALLISMVLVVTGFIARVFPSSRTLSLDAAPVVTLYMAAFGGVFMSVCGLPLHAGLSWALKRWTRQPYEV